MFKGQTPEKTNSSNKYISHASVSSDLALNASMIPSLETSEPQIHLFKSQIILNPTITRMNFAAFLLYCIYEGFIFLPIGLLQLPLLSIVYGKSSSDQINIVTITQLSQIGCKMLYLPFLGYLCDKHGRRLLIIIAIVSACTAIGFLPILPSIVPFYYLASILQDFGMTALLIPPLLADYVDYETKGRVSGLKTIISAAAAFGASYLAENINLKGNIPVKYYEIAGLGLVLGFVIAIGLKGGPYHKALFFDKKAEEAKRKAAEMIEQERKSELEKLPDADQQNSMTSHIQKRATISFTQLPKTNQALELIEAENNTEDEKPGLIAGLREAKRNPWILAGYISAFLSNAFIMSGNTALINYVMHVTGDENSATQAFSLINKQLLTAGLCAILFGFGTDKYNKFRILIFIVICSMVGIILLIITPSPYDFLAYLSMIFYGIGMAGFTTFVSQVTSKYPNPKYRASVGAIATMCSTIGGAMISILGVFLSKFDYLIPFYMYLGTSIIGLCILMLAYFMKKDILDKL